METLFFIISICSLFSIPICLILFVIALFKKNGKAKKWIISSGVSFVLFIVAVGIYGSNLTPSQSEAANIAKSEKTENLEKKIEETPKPQESDKPVDSSSTNSEAEAQNNTEEMTIYDNNKDIVHEKDSNENESEKSNNDTFTTLSSVEDDYDNSGLIGEYDLKYKNSHELFADIDAEEKRSLNLFFSNFSEVNLKPFVKEQYDPKDLIRFALLHNRFNKRELFLPEDNSMESIKDSYIAATIKKYFDVETMHQSIPGFEHKNSKYYCVTADGNAISIFSQVRKINTNDDGTFEAFIEVYETGVDGLPDNYDINLLMILVLKPP